MASNYVTVQSLSSLNNLMLINSAIGFRNGNFSRYYLLIYVEAKCIIYTMCYYDNRQRGFNCYNDNFTFKWGNQYRMRKDS